MPVDPSGFDKVAKKMKELYGDDVLHAGSEDPPVDRIPTGSVELDYATGGGIPIGRFTRFYGGYSSAKSLTCWKVISSAQAMGMKCVYFNIEKQFTKEFVERIGVDVKDLYVVEGQVMEDIATQLESLLAVSHVLVLDSLSSAVSQEELSAKPGDWTMGLAARVWGKTLRRALERFDQHGNTVILVDQVRDVFGSGGGEEPPGGRFVEHTSSLSLYFRRSSWLGRTDAGILDPDATMSTGMSDATEPDGIEFLVRVNKSRVCRPLRTARLRLDFADMKFDTMHELAKAAKYFDVVDVGKGGWYTLPNGQKVQGLPKFREHLEKDTDLQAKIKDEVMRHA